MQKQPAKLPIQRRLLSWLFLLALLVPVACSQNELGDLEQNTNADAALDGTWKVIAYEDLTSNTRIVKDNVNSGGGLDVVLTFTGDRITGKNTTNQVSMTISYPAPEELKITEYHTSEVNQPLWGNLFNAAARELKEFEVNDTRLRVYYNNGNNAVLFEKQ